MDYIVWKITGQHAIEITEPDTRAYAETAAVTLNAYAPAGVRYVALPLGGSPFDD